MIGKKANPTTMKASGNMNKNPSRLNPIAPITPPVKKRPMSELSRRRLDHSAANGVSLRVTLDHRTRPKPIPMSVTIPVMCVLRMTELDILVMMAF
jgi:hypothetical protein